MKLLVLVWVLGGCQWFKDAAGTVGGTIADYTICPADLSSIIECGHVFQCEGTVNPDPHSNGYVEICIDDDDHPEQLDAIEMLYGMCSPTPRHQGLCDYHCDAGAGCNAFNGCYCP